MFKNDKKISVIIPIYQSEKYLDKCLVSVINQSYKNIEIIVVNNGSFDHSQNIVDEYAAQYKNIKSIKLAKNCGSYHARLIGFEHSTGDYITFLDSDDYLGKDALRAYIKEAEYSNSDIVIGKMVIEWESDNRQEVHVYNEPDFTVLEGTEIVEHYISQEAYTFYWFALWNKIYKREIIDKALPYLNRIKLHTVMNEDIAFSTVLYAMTNKLTCIDYYTIYYLQSESSVTGKAGNIDKYMKDIEDACRVLRFCREFVYEHPQYRTVKENYKRFEEVIILYWENNVNSSSLPLSHKKKCIRELKAQSGYKVFPNHNRPGLRSLKYGVDRSFIYAQSSSFNTGYEDMIMKIMDSYTERVIFPAYQVLFSPLIRSDIYEDILLDIYEKYIGQESAKKCLEDLRFSGENHLDLHKIHSIMARYTSQKQLLELLEKEELLQEDTFVLRKSALQLISLAIYLGKSVFIEVANASEYLLSLKVLDYLEASYTIKNEHVLVTSVGKIDSPHTLRFVTELEEEAVYETSLKVAYPSAFATFIKYCDPYKAKYKIADNVKIVNENIELDMSLRVVASIYFDNPYLSFEQNMDYNRDVYFMGLYPLGMYLMGTSIWLKDIEYDELTFDGKISQLIIEAYNLFCDNTKTSLMGCKDVNSSHKYDALSIKPFEFEKNNYGPIYWYLFGRRDDRIKVFFSETLIRNRLKQGALDFTARMSRLYHCISFYQVDTLKTWFVPFNYFLYHSNFEDLRIFDYCSIYSGEKRGEQERSLFAYWLEQTHKEDYASRNGNTLDYYPHLESKSRLIKLIYWLLFDRQTLKRRLEIFLRK